MSSRQYRSYPMSWIFPTVLFVIVGFALAFAVTELFVRGRRWRSRSRD